LDRSHRFWLREVNRTDHVGRFGTALQGDMRCRLYPWIS
jgi:hypothetical protein